MRQIIYNAIQTPDGTIIESHSVHDFVTHTDKNGFSYSVDGGHDYLKRNFDNSAPKATDLSIYSDASFEEIRKVYKRGGRGVNNDQPLTWVALENMSEDWLKACIVYNNERGREGCFANKMYEKELEYRK